jgi:predicted nucleic acid-binding protein
MKDYWDSSALVEASMDVGLRTRLRTKGGITRIHTLAECFSALTAGGLAVRLDADAAAQMLDNLAADLEFVELTPPEVLSALKKARKRGVRGGRVHDYLHAVAADKSGAVHLLTLDEHDFDSLADKVTVEQV